MLKKYFSTPLYVQVGINRIDVKNVADGQSVTLIPEAPFSSDRLLVGDFSKAEALLKKGLKEVARHGMFAVSPAVLMHPLEKVEGGLSQVEERVLTELALGSGAADVVVWVGALLSDQEVLNKLGKQ
jgi:rod shape-determining protein MreB